MEKAKGHLFLSFASFLCIIPLSGRKGFPGGLVGKNLPANAGDTGLIPGWEDPLEEGTAPHSSILAWRILWTGAWRAAVSGLAEPDTT